MKIKVILSIASSVLILIICLFSYSLFSGKDDNSKLKYDQRIFQQIDYKPGSEELYKTGRSDICGNSENGNYLLYNYSKNNLRNELLIRDMRSKQTKVIASTYHESTYGTRNNGSISHDGEIVVFLSNGFAKSFSIYNTKSNSTYEVSIDEFTNNNEYRITSFLLADNVSKLFFTLKNVSTSEYSNDTEIFCFDIKQKTTNIVDLNTILKKNEDDYLSSNCDLLNVYDVSDDGRYIIVSYYISSSDESSSGEERFFRFDIKNNELFSLNNVLSNGKNMLDLSDIRFLDNNHIIILSNSSISSNTITSTDNKNNIYIYDFTTNNNYLVSNSETVPDADIGFINSFATSQCGDYLIFEFVDMMNEISWIIRYDIKNKTCFTVGEFENIGGIEEMSEFDEIIYDKGKGMFISEEGTCIGFTMKDKLGKESCFISFIN